MVVPMRNPVARIGQAINSSIGHQPVDEGDENANPKDCLEDYQ